MVFSATVQIPLVTSWPRIDTVAGGPKRADAGLFRSNAGCRRLILTLSSLATLIKVHMTEG